MRRFRLRHFRPDPEEDVREELDSHLELEADALEVSGLDRVEARSVAEARLGNRKSIERDASRYAARSMRRQRLGATVDAVNQDLRLAARTLMASRSTTAITLLLLALGIGAITALFSALKSVVLEPLGLPGADQLVFLWEDSPETPMGPVAFADYQDWREESRTVPEMGAYLARHVNLTDGGDPVRVRGALVTASLFRTLGMDPALGRPLADEEDFSGDQLVVLDHSTWQGRYGADPGLLGNTVDVDGTPHTVVGIMPPDFLHPDPGSPEPIQLWLPLPPGTEMEPRRSRSFQVVGRLGGGVALSQAREELNDLAARLANAHPDTNTDVRIRAEPVHRVLFGEAGQQLSLILGAAALVLLIACGNIASIQLARSFGRRTELAVRRALGGSRRRILKQLLTESLLLAVLGGGSGLLVAWWGVEILRAFMPSALPRAGATAMDLGALLFTLVASLTVGLLFGVAPAATTVRVRLREALQDGRRGTGSRGGKSLLHAGFLVAQLTLSLVLANTALLLFGSYRTLQDNELGFEATSVLTLNLSLRGSGYSVVHGRAEFYDELLPRLRALPGVRAVGAGTSLPFMASAETRVLTEESWAADPSSEGMTLDFDRVAGDYFPSLGIPLEAGRFFIRGEDDATLGDDRVILNRSAARALWQEADPIGRRIAFDSQEPRWMTVIGVVGDIRNRGLGLPPAPEAYLPYASLPTGMMYLTVKVDADPLSLASAVREEIRRIDPLQAVSQVQSMETVAERQLARREFYTTLVGAFAALALLLAGVGVYGVLSHQVAGRIHEIGIRMALGAGQERVLRLTLERGLALATIGLVLGSVGIFLIRHLLRSFLYGIGPLDPSTLAAGGLSLLGTTVLAAILPALRASRVDPVEALRAQ